MKYQLSVSAMHQKDYSICERMNISSDAIIINQTDNFEYKKIEKDGDIIHFFSFNERGVGLSRNSAIMRATADIVQFADDDMIFTDTYKEQVIREFENHPEADAILFSVQSLNPKRPLLKISKFCRVRRREALKYGCARLAIRREKVLCNNICFSLLFGGGANYGSGEDTIFLQECIKSGLKIYKSPIRVADIKQDDSTWFNGYNYKYYFDKGVLFATIMPKLCWLYAFITFIKVRISFKNNKDYRNILKAMIKGIIHQKKTF